MFRGCIAAVYAHHVGRFTKIPKALFKWFEVFAVVGAIVLNAPFEAAVSCCANRSFAAHLHVFGVVARGINVTLVEGRKIIALQRVNTLHAGRFAKLEHTNPASTVVTWYWYCLRKYNGS